MKELKNIEELKKIIENDSRAIQILDMMQEENQRDFRRYKWGNVLLGAAVACGCCGIIASILIQNTKIGSVCILVTISLCVIVGYLHGLFSFNEKEVISDDELLFLNTILEEKTKDSVGKYPIIQKKDQCFIEENGILSYIGKAENKTMTECEKFSYKQIEDSEGLYHPRYQVLTCSEVMY